MNPPTGPFRLSVYATDPKGWLVITSHGKTIASVGNKKEQR